MLIGLTGRNAAGKGEVAKHLQSKSFHYYSLSDAIRDEIRARRQAVSRELLIQVGNELRTQYGPAILAERILQRIEHDKNYVIDSIRNPAEVETFRRASHFRLLHVKAPIELRFKRTVQRGRENDPTNFEKFKELEDREATGDATSQNLEQVEKLADEVIENNSSIDELGPKIDALVARLAQERS
jgi:dephospho-CoA kinase